ncbi:membrane protein-like protein [Methylobacterium sp. 4-46]|nr:membrane protein-like protein [Methylobacterium sp. 4-46]
MTLHPLLTASPLIQIHAAAALAALGLGAAQLVLPRGGARHRGLGWVWVGLMALVALSSFGIWQVRQFGPFGWIHGLSAATLASLVAAVAHARRGRIAAHRLTMTSLFAGGLVVTGLFTLLPGRIMHRVLFTDGPAPAASREGAGEQEVRLPPEIRAAEEGMLPGEARARIGLGEGGGR